MNFLILSGEQAGVNSLILAKERCARTAETWFMTEQTGGKSQKSLAEPWLRATLDEVPAVPRAVLHALELASEDLQKWCGQLTDEQLNARPAGLASVAFHLRHIAGSVDRLLCYAENRALSSEQLSFLKKEMEDRATVAEASRLVQHAFATAATRIRALAAQNLEESRSVGKKQLPTTLGGLLVHVADHTQRHVGQAIVTARIVAAS
jgi:uncharacterized damage-inducible protein DinB